MVNEQQPVMIVAFEGWNDAGSAASTTIDILAEEWNAESVGSLEGDFYDLQVTRPTVERDDDGVRQIRWPGLEVLVGEMPSGRRVVLMRGDEPSHRWKAFVTELLAKAAELGCTDVIVLGALLADVPHTRDLPVSATSSSPQVREAFDLVESEYEGPTGIVGVLEAVAASMGFGTLSLWASVPHYVSEIPCPKGALALTGLLGSLLDVPIIVPDLVEDARRWEQAVSEMAAESPEITGYVAQLERARDAADSPDATGEAIAREFERYLRRRDQS